MGNSDPTPYFSRSFHRSGGHGVPTLPGWEGTAGEGCANVVALRTISFHGNKKHILTRHTYQ